MIVGVLYLGLSVVRLLSIFIPVLPDFHFKSEKGEKGSNSRSGPAVSPL